MAADQRRSRGRSGQGSAFTANGRHYLVVSIGDGVRVAKRVPGADTIEDARRRARVAAELATEMVRLGLSARLVEVIEEVARAPETAVVELRASLLRQVARSPASARS